VERAPGVLLEAGLADGLDARWAGCLPAGGYSGVPDPRTKVMNPQPLHDYSRSLADRVGAAGASREAVTFLTRHGGPSDGFWIHLDADVFDQTIMRSVDDPRPDGLTWDDGVAVLRTAIASSQAVGFQVAIYNPTLTQTGPTAAGWPPPSAARLPASADRSTFCPRGSAPHAPGVPRHSCFPRQPARPPRNNRYDVTSWRSGPQQCHIVAVASDSVL
jgi:hypothetical protein